MVWAWVCPMGHGLLVASRLGGMAIGACLRHQASAAVGTSHARTAEMAASLARDWGYTR